MLFETITFELESLGDNSLENMEGTFEARLINMHGRDGVLFRFVHRDRKNVGDWFDLVLETVTEVQECIKENVFNVPKLLSFKL